jgi:hypothetical protein
MPPGFLYLIVERINIGLKISYHVFLHSLFYSSTIVLRHFFWAKKVMAKFPSKGYW